MGIRRIDYKLCAGCGTCVQECPMDVLRMDETTKKPFIKYLRDCQNCFLCERNCPNKAIFVTPYRERRVPSPFSAAD